MHSEESGCTNQSHLCALSWVFDICMQLPADFQHCPNSTEQCNKSKNYWSKYLIIYRHTICCTWIMMTVILSELHILSFRVCCREEAHAVWSSPDATAWPELLRPLPGGIHDCLQSQSPDASVELLHHWQASKCVICEERIWKIYHFHTRNVKCSDILNLNPIKGITRSCPVMSGLWIVHNFKLIWFLITDLWLFKFRFLL